MHTDLSSWIAIVVSTPQFIDRPHISTCGINKREIGKEREKEEGDGRNQENENKPTELDRICNGVNYQSLHSFMNVT